MSQKQTGLQAAGDLVLSIFITLFAVFVIVESLRMPHRGHLGLLVTPGFSPFFTGVALLLLSLILDIRAIRRKGHIHLGSWLKAAVAEEENQRFLVILAAMGLYVVVLLGRVSYVAATFVFHALVFTYLKIGKPLKIIAYALLATALVSLLLPKLFEMPVP